MSNLCVIPARGGSKRVPRKNVRIFAGRPIIGWSIAAALESNCFERVIVSTEDQEIANIAIENGAEAPFLRPPALATDTAREFRSVVHALDWLGERGASYDNACCLYATAPFVTPDAIRRGLALLESGSYDFVFPVTSFEFPVLRSLRLHEDTVSPAFPDSINQRSQDLEEHVHDAGQFYWGRVETFRQHDTPFASLSNRIGALLTPRSQVQDIDTEEDWKVAETLFTAMRENLT